MRVALELSVSFPFPLPSKDRTLLCLQGSANTFPSPLSEVYIPVHGVYRMFGTHLQLL
jgi:hypothetical protein